MIVITGAAGFIASCLVAKLNEEGFKDLVLVDDFSRPDKELNYIHKTYAQLVHRDEFFIWLDANHHLVQFIFHLGARTDTAEFDEEVLNRLNLEYSKKVWHKCIQYALPLVYASSAATYGDGSLGYSDAHDMPEKLSPLNPYGISKNEFDKWVLKQAETPYFWAGLKFFNVYGPNEFHKNRMASVIFHTFQQVMAEGKTRLFRSHRPDFKDGAQMRDFVYVKDVCDILYFLMLQRTHSAIYNLGSGQARTFLDLAKGVFAAMDREPIIEFIDTPMDIRDKYQYFTEADMHKIQAAGYQGRVHTLEEGIADYVQHYLIPGKRW